MNTNRFMQYLRAHLNLGLSETEIYRPANFSYITYTCKYGEVTVQRRYRTIKYTLEDAFDVISAVKKLPGYGE